jgi:hypothetical protein
MSPRLYSHGDNRFSDLVAYIEPTSTFRELVVTVGIAWLPLMVAFVSGVSPQLEYLGIYIFEYMGDICASEVL